MGNNIYLGIDGVILTRGVLPALHLDKFLKYITANYNVSWLSSRCRGSSEGTEKYLAQFLEEDTLSLMKPIKPTNYSLDKTEAIDFNKNFFWLDSQLFDSEKNTLKEHNYFNSWIELDLISNPDQLLQVIHSSLSTRSKSYQRG